MSSIVCPNCRSSNVRRSHTHGIREQLLKYLGRRAFRCRDCGWRGLLHAASESSSRIRKRESYVFAVILGIVVLVLLFIFNFRTEQIEKIARAFLGSPK